MAQPDPFGGRLPAVAAPVPAAPVAAARAAVHVGAVAATAPAGGRRRCRSRCRRRRDAVLGVALVVVVVVGEELALGVRDGEVAEDVLRVRIAICSIRVRLFDSIQVQGDPSGGEPGLG